MNQRDYIRQNFLDVIKTTTNYIALTHNDAHKLDQDFLNIMQVYDTMQEQDHKYKDGIPQAINYIQESFRQNKAEKSLNYVSLMEKYAANVGMPYQFNGFRGILKRAVES